jgi:hypothetical protein
MRGFAPYFVAHRNAINLDRAGVPVPGPVRLVTGIAGLAGAALVVIFLAVAAVFAADVAFHILTG